MPTPDSGKSFVRPGVQHGRGEAVRPSGAADLLARVQGVGDRPQFPIGWTAYAYWFEDPANVITSMTATWIVPPAPKNKNGQLIYLFNGLQRYAPMKDPAARYILQPVLQWGISPDGGGPFWSVASWCFDHKKRGFKSPSVKVKEADRLTGVLKLIDQDQGRFHYSCEFAGIDGTMLRAVGLGQLVMPVATLECYGIKSLDDYPNTLKTSLQAINVTTTAGPIELKFAKSEDESTGQHAGIVSNAKGAGVVDLFYRQSTADDG